MSDEASKAELLQLTSKIAASYVGNNTVGAGDLGSVINSIYKSLVSIDGKIPEESTPSAVPAVSIKKSVTAAHLVCLECGRQLKMLKRHIKTDHDLTIDAYKAKWGLSSDYPTTAPAYAAERSQMALKIGLGRKSNPRGRKPKSN